MVRSLPLWLRTGARRIVQWPFRSFKNFFFALTSTLALGRWIFGDITTEEMATVMGIFLKLFGL